jgi:ADP-heptose:LPS heptosyltransferase
MNIFDEIVLIETGSARQVISSALRATRKAWRADCIVDLEIHSKLSTVFCLLTCARNRVGYYMGQNSWRLGLGTHFLFLNHSSLIATSYNQLATVFEAEIDLGATVEWFRSQNEIEWEVPPLSSERVWALAPYCSELGKVREFAPAEWAQILREKLDGEHVALVLLGDPSRVDEAAELERVLAEEFEGCEFVNLVGKTSLREVVGVLRSVDELVTIDSGVNHLARLLGVDITSFWGPTDPETRLLQLPDLNECVFYRKIFCSPCVHHIDFAPCLGNNICMKQHLGPVDIDSYANVGWTIDRDRSLL